MLFCLNNTQPLQAQEPLQLEMVEVVTEKYVISQIGKKVEQLDSAYLQQYKMNSVAEAIGSNSGIFMKSYGLGASTSSSFRGGSANQTALLWNGLNIQNPMLGQNDLSLLPSFLFNKVNLEYGGSSSLWGSGAVAGSIQLDNELHFNKGFQTSVMAGGGSYGLNHQALSQLISGKKVVSQTKMYHINSVNNYEYKNDIDANSRTQKLKHANYIFNGFMQDLKWQINNQQTLVFKCWLNNNQRNLPTYNTFNNKATQFDAANRFSLDWHYSKNNYYSSVKAAFLNDVLNYNDSLTKIYSRSRVNTFVLEQQHHLVFRRHIFQFGTNFTNNTAYTNNYNGTKSLEKVAFLLGDFIYLSRYKLKLNMALRFEAFSNGNKPITGNVSMDYKLNKKVLLALNTSKVYRQPSLNELYWWPGGNSNLKPEEGYAGEGNIKFKQTKNHLNFEINASAFHRIINNWILWTPGVNANPTPLNIQKVWSRGTETSVKIKYTIKKVKLGCQANASYVLSTVLQNSQENANVIDKQLIYTPRYNYNGYLFINYQQFSLYFIHQYVGYRFITSDNTQWLSPYQVSSLKFSASLLKKSNTYQLFFSCNNLFNNQYAVIINRPMPYRNYEVGITYLTSKNKTRQNEKNNLHNVSDVNL